MILEGIKEEKLYFRIYYMKNVFNKKESSLDLSIENLYSSFLKIGLSFTDI